MYEARSRVERCRQPLSRAPLALVERRAVPSLGRKFAGF